jgi:drug/metabolite transporter (DMT)-like permease
VLRNGGIATLKCRNPGLQIVRGFAMLGSSLAFVHALSALPLALATAISFTAPFFTTALSALFLGEVVRMRRWMAIAVGLAGVLIVLRPNAATFEIAMLLPILSALCWSIGLVITRKIARDEGPMTTIVLSSVIGLIGTSILLPPVWVAPDAQNWLLLVAIGGLNVIGQFLLIGGFQRAPASMLAPYAYSTIVWAVIFGVLVFGTWPDRTTWIGAFVIVASGLYIWHRERVLHRPPVIANAAIGGAKGLARKA